MPQNIPEFICFFPSAHLSTLNVSATKQSSIPTISYQLLAGAAPCSKELPHFWKVSPLLSTSPAELSLGGKQGSSQSLGNTDTSSNSWTQRWLLSLQNAAASEARMGTRDPFILQRRRKQGHNAKHPDFPHFWARQVENRTASRARRETQTPWVQCFMVLQPNLKFLPLKVLKLLFLRLKIDEFVPLPKCNFSYSGPIVAAPSVSCLGYFPGSLDTRFKG